MCHVCAKFVPQFFSDNQLECRKTIAGDLFEQSVQDRSFLGKVVTGDESWVFAYDPETKMQSSKGHTNSSPHPKKSQATKSDIRVMLVAFFNEGIVQCELVPSGTSVTAAFYMDVLTHLRESVRQKRSQKWKNDWGCITIMRPVKGL
jgi:hypothetical protein